MLKTDLEIELEKALDERGIYLSMMDKDVVEKFKELDLKQYPAPPEQTEDLDDDEKEDLEFLPEAVKKYKEIKEKEYEEARKEWAEKVGPEGVRAWHDKTFEMAAEALDELAMEKGISIPFKLANGGVYKQRTAEINNFSIMYVVVCDRSQPEKCYAKNKKHLLLEGIKIAKTVFPGIGEEKREQIIDIKYKNHQYKETSIGENARQVMDDISELRILKRKYAHREKVEPKDVVEDVMKLIGC